MSLFKDLETGARGFAMTGKEEFMEPYSAASARIAPALNALKAELKEVPLPAFSWSELEESVSKRQMLTARTIAERREGGNKDFHDTALLVEGKLVMDKLRLQVATLDTLLGQRVELLSDELAAERKRMRQSLWLTSLAAWLLVVFAIGFWMRERQRRGLLYAELAGSHAQLESRVQERTAELQIMQYVIIITFSLLRNKASVYAGLMCQDIAFL